MFSVLKHQTDYVILKEPRKFILRGELKNLANTRSFAEFVLNARSFTRAFAGANAPVLIVTDLMSVYDDVPALMRQYSS